MESRSDRHEDALKVLSRVPRVEGLAEAGRHLAELLKAKSSIEYGGAELKPDEAARIAAHATRFVAFVEEKLPK